MAFDFYIASPDGPPIVPILLSGHMIHILSQSNFYLETVGASYM